jgi:hypothetical protein
LLVHTAICQRFELFKGMAYACASPRSWSRNRTKTTRKAGLINAYELVRLTIGRRFQQDRVITMNRAAFAPIPSARASTATAVNPGLFAKMRIANWMSASKYVCSDKTFRLTRETDSQCPFFVGIGVSIRLHLPLTTDPSNHSFLKPSTISWFLILIRPR